MKTRILSLLMCLIMAFSSVAFAEGGDGGQSLLDSGYTQCPSCSGWYLSGNEYRNHFCTGNPKNPSSSWTSNDDYYKALVNGEFDSDKVVAIGNLYVNTANGKSLNMRSRPDTNASVITQLPNGTAVTLFWYEGSNWAFVAYRSYFGFCMTRHLSENKPSSTVTPSVTPTPGTTTPTTTETLSKLFRNFKPANYYVSVKPSTPTGFVNLRWAPTKEAPVQAIYYANTVLKVISTNGTWSQVYNEATGVGGFMMNSFLNKYLN